MPSSTHGLLLSPADVQLLLDLARDAIVQQARGTTVENPPLKSLPEALSRPAATFVTLHLGSTLRGCCGSLSPFEPLAWNVVRSARTAAFSDHRFRPVHESETPDLSVHISILGPTSPIDFVTESDLASQLRPGRDGVILFEADLGKQGVFLPAVWEQLPDPRQFVRRLKQKAGLPSDFWSPWLTAQRFEVHSIPADGVE